jgi:hypothetical protein
MLDRHFPAVSFAFFRIFLPLFDTGVGIRYSVDFFYKGYTNWAIAMSVPIFLPFLTSFIINLIAWIKMKFSPKYSIEESDALSNPFWFLPIIQIFR